MKILNLPPITVEIEDIRGNIVKLVAKTISAKQANKINEVLDSKAPIGDKLLEQMVIVFGGKTKDYEIFDVRVLQRALDYFVQQMQNPTK